MSQDVYSHNSRINNWKCIDFNLLDLESGITFDSGFSGTYAIIITVHLGMSSLNLNITNNPYLENQHHFIHTVRKKGFPPCKCIMCVCKSIFASVMILTSQSSPTPPP